MFNMKQVINTLRSPDIVEKTSMAWNLGGPSIYNDHLTYMRQHPKDLFACQVYMTKIYKTFNCDVFYPLKSWNNVIGRFKELPVSDDIPYPLGQMIKDDENVDISFHVFELIN